MSDCLDSDRGLPKTTVTIHTGNCLDVLATMPDQSVHCCVTSPPYFGLRDYGREGQIGLEDTPDAYVARLVEVFREVRRVLRDDGTVWLNLGDSYAAERGGTHQPAETLAGGRKGKSVNGARVNRDRHDGYNPTRFASRIGLKHKDMIGIPWRVAFALQSEGWHLRQDIIWSKPNPMPESVRDRCTKAHEYVFLLSKGPRYYFDAEAIKEPAVSGHSSGNGFKRPERLSYRDKNGKAIGDEKQWQWGGSETKRNRRSVWTVNTKPFKAAHFATFPPDLIEPCILAGCPLGGVVVDPFGGAGTTGLVASRLGRCGVLIELNPEYSAMALNRTQEDEKRRREQAKEAERQPLLF